MSLKLESIRRLLVFTVLFVGAILFTCPTHAQVKQKVSKEVKNNPVKSKSVKVEEDNDSKPVLIKQDSSLITKENLPTKDTIAPEDLKDIDNTAIPSDPAHKVVKKNPKPGVVKISKKEGLAKPVRFEKRLNVASGNLHVLTFAKKVLVVYPAEERAKKGKKKWNFECYDGDLKKLWQQQKSIPKRWGYCDSKVIDRLAYVSFARNAKAWVPTPEITRRAVFGSIKRHSYEMLTITPRGEMKSFIPRFSKRTTGNLDVATIGKDNVYYAGHTTVNFLQLSAVFVCNFYCCLLPYSLGINPQQRPILVQSALNNYNPKSAAKIKIETQRFGEVRSLNYDPVSKETNVMIITAPRKHVINEDIIQFDETGKNASKISLQPGNKYILKDADVLTSESGTKYCFGSYTILDPNYYRNKNLGLSSHSLSSLFKKSTKAPKPKKSKLYFGNNGHGCHIKELKTNDKDGFYVAKIIDGQQEGIAFTPYRKVKSYVNVWNKINEQEAQRVDKTLYNHVKFKNATGMSFLPHKIIDYNGELIYVSEVYNPIWKTKNNTVYFYGYLFTQAIIVAFDYDGTLLWENTFEMGNLLTFNLKPHVSLFFENEKIVMSYATNGQIYSKAIAGHEVVDQKSSTKIDLKGKEVVKANYEQDMEYWYENYFVVFGLQKLKDGSGGVSSKRRDKKEKHKNSNRTFFMNKVAYQ